MLLGHCSWTDELTLSCDPLSSPLLSKSAELFLGQLFNNGDILSLETIQKRYIRNWCRDLTCIAGKGIDADCDFLRQFSFFQLHSLGIHTLVLYYQMKRIHFQELDTQIRIIISRIEQVISVNMNRIGSRNYL